MHVHPSLVSNGGGNGHALCRAEFLPNSQPAQPWQHAAAIFEFVILSIPSCLANATLQLCTGYCRGVNKYVYEKAAAVTVDAHA